MTETLKQLFIRELEKLKLEITSYKSEGTIWKISGDVKNSAGNLCLHICGNLQHFIGAVLGNSGYVRNRDAEFSRNSVPIRELVAEIDLTAQVVNEVLDKLEENDLQKTYPINVFGYEMTTEYLLTNIAAHLTYHLGQINYQRRLLEQ